MGGSGVIYAGIVAAWAAYFVTWLRRQEPVDTSRSVDRFSSAMRVLSRREPADAHSRTMVSASAASAAGTAVRPPAPQRPTIWDSRREVYRRRRQVLLLLVVALLGVTGTAAGAAVPWWAVAVPACLLLGYLSLLRRVGGASARAARRVGAVRTPATSQPTTSRSTDRVLHLGSFRSVTRAVGKALLKSLVAPTARPAQAPTARAGTVAPPAMQHSHREVASGPAAMIGADRPAPLIEPVAVPVSYDEDSELAGGGTSYRPVDPVAHSGWEPVPVPLPTYVTAPRAQRVIRTIDLATPGAWTSGRLAVPPRDEHGMEPGAERDDLPAFVGEPTSPGTGAQAPTAGAVEHRRAVGD